MRLRALRIVFIGILCGGLLACNPPKTEAPVRLPVEPPPGWRVGRQVPRKNVYSASFVPKQRTKQERMWITILRRPEFPVKSIDELLATFQPHFICKSRDLNVIRKDPNDVLFEEKDSVCYGKPFRYTIGRITRGKTNVSFYAYRADLQDLPADRRDFIIKALSSAPLDTSGLPPLEKAAASSPSASLPPVADSHLKGPDDDPNP